MNRDPFFDGLFVMVVVLIVALMALISDLIEGRPIC